MRRCLATLIVAAIATPARADQDLAEARRLQAALDYEGALAVVDKAIAHGGADPERLAELHLLGGTLAAELDRTDVAIDHFSHLLALRPKERLPQGTPPKISAPFDAARAHGIPPLHITPTYIHGVVTIVPDADPLHLVHGMEVRVVDPIGRLDDVSSNGALRVELPAGTRATEVSAVDEYGNRVWVSPISEPPPVVVELPWYSSWKTYAIAAGVSTVIGLYAARKVSDEQAAWDALRADDGTHDFSELASIQREGEKWATTANIAFVIAGAIGTVAAVQAIRHAPRHREPRVVITPGPGVGVGLAGGF